MFKTIVPDALLLTTKTAPETENVTQAGSTGRSEKKEFATAPQVGLEKIVA